MKTRKHSTQTQKMSGMFRQRSQVENKGNVATLTDLVNFLKTCDYFKKLINEYENVEAKGLDIIKGKILVNEKTKFAKEHPELPGFEQVEKYLKFVTLSNENGIESPVTIDSKPLIGIDIQKWLVDHGGLGDRSTHSKNILYTTKNDNFQISRAQHTRSGLLEDQAELPQRIQEAGLQNILVGAFFLDQDTSTSVRRSNFSNLNLNYSNFNNVLAEETLWINTKIQHADLQNSLLKNANVSYADFSYSDLMKTKFYGHTTKAINTIFSFADMRRAHLDGINLTNAKFVSTNAQGIGLNGANLYKADFSHADLTDAVMYTYKHCKTNINNANFSYAILKNINLRGIDCFNVTFDYAIANKTNFIDIVSLEGSSFVGIDLTESKFFLVNNINRDKHSQSKFTNLKRTNFSNANLSNGHLHSVDLTGAKLNNAILKNSQLIYINLTNADLSGVDFENASFHLVRVTATELAKAKNIDKITFHKSSKEIQTYKQLCEMDETKLDNNQRSFCNLIAAALAIQNPQKEKQEEEATKEKIKEGKQEVSDDSGEEEKIATSSQDEIVPANKRLLNVGMEFDPTDEKQTVETQFKIEKKRKKKGKAKAEKETEPTQTSSNHQAIVKHGFFNKDTQNNINKYQQILKNICAIVIGLGSLYAIYMMMANQNDDERNKNCLKF